MTDKDAVFDAILDFVENNTKLIAEGLDMIVKKMVAEGKLPLPPPEAPETEEGE